MLSHLLYYTRVPLNLLLWKLAVTAIRDALRREQSFCGTELYSKSQSASAAGIGPPIPTLNPPLLQESMLHGPLSPGFNRASSVAVLPLKGF